MKIVQTYWSVPSRGTEEENGRFKGGWLAEKYHLMSIALSCLRIRKYYPRVQLVTDNHGKALLIDALQLPYTEVDLSLNQFEQYPQALWAIPKIHAYGLQQEPFLHVDNDVFIWEAFPAHVSQAPLTAQNLETNTIVYREALEYIFAELPHVPDYFDRADAAGEAGNHLGTHVVAINAGVFGGTDTAFIRYYCEQALRCVALNLPEIAAGGKAGSLNLIFEQYLFYKLTQQQQRRVDTLFDQVGPGFYVELFEIDKVPFLRKYVHMLGSSKQAPTACEQVEFRLKHEFPAYYERVMAYLQNIPGYVDEPLDALVPPFALPASGRDVRPRAAVAGGPFARTLRFLAPRWELPADSTRAQVEAAVAEASPLLDLAQADQLRTLFRFECLGSDLLGGEPYSTEAKFRKIRRSYQALDHLDTEGVLAHPLLASPHIRVLPSRWSLTELNAADAQQPAAAREGNRYFLLVELTGESLVEQELDAWPRMLYYFQDEPITGNELLEQLCANTNVLQHNSREVLKTSVLEFLTMNLVYDGYLEFAPSGEVSAAQL
ncbi:hypothetical protein D3Y59_12040 [Hymenobacter oligotrophus]|uniref:DUF6734 domain-containing protein n=1 Tax=Hymenobacter oligotrophus TaxID=2319843 RepID=A0A3B7R1R4_9BACT|nr:DUF6734 family protein [Hymenobacter oligotrophus]AYA37712.1 hypothetical protein D3Y59_12040 [Hymenobacter oligotrophus]